MRLIIHAVLISDKGKVTKITSDLDEEVYARPCAQEHVINDVLGMFASEVQHAAKGV